MDERPSDPEVKPNLLVDAAMGRPVEVRLNRLATAVGRPIRAAALPGVSTRWTGFVLMVCLVLAAVALPLFLHRSAWVEAESVLLAWFLIWTGVLTWLGYRGRPLVDDGPPPMPRQSLGHGSQDKSTGRRWPDWGWDGSFDVGDGDGIGGLLLAIVAVAIVTFILVFVVQFVLPIVMGVLYALIRLMLGRVADRADATRGQLAASLGRGALWAAVFVGPLALGVWLIHAVL